MVIRWCYCWWKKSCTSWYGSLSHYLQGFIHVRWCRNSSINSRWCYVSWKGRFPPLWSTTYNMATWLFLPNVPHGVLEKKVTTRKFQPLRLTHLDEFETLKTKQKIVVSPPKQHEHPFKKVVLPSMKINLTPENWWLELENYLYFGKVSWKVRTVSFKECFKGCIWVFPKISGTPKWMVKIMENPIKMDDFGVPLFLETPIYVINSWTCFSLCAVGIRTTKV